MSRLLIDNFDAHKQHIPTPRLWLRPSPIATPAILAS